MEINKKELEMWQNLKLSLLGRIAVIKTNVLPKNVIFIPKPPYHSDLKNIQRVE